MIVVDSVVKTSNPSTFLVIALSVRHPESHHYFRSLQNPNKGEFNGIDTGNRKGSWVDIGAYTRDCMYDPISLQLRFGGTLYYRHL